MALLASAAILVSTAPAMAAPASPTPTVQAASWGTDLYDAGVAIKSATESGDVELLERAVGDAQRTLKQLSKQSKATQATLADMARTLKSLTAVGAVTSYQQRVKDCKKNSLARMAGIAKTVRNGRATLSSWIGTNAKNKRWLKKALADLDRELPACLHLTLTFDSFMTLNDPKWEIAGQFSVPLEFRMDPNGKPYWTGKQTGIVENATLDNADGCRWSIDPKPFTFDVDRLELDFGLLGTTDDVILKEYSTDATMVDTATAVCPDNSPPPTPIWGWSMIFADLRGFFDAGTWPELRDWQTPTAADSGEMFKVLKGGTGSTTGFTESSTMFLYRR